MKRIIQILVTAQFALAMSLQTRAQQGPTIPELVRRGLYDSYLTTGGATTTFESLVQQSELIVRCRIISAQSQLTKDQRNLFTDYVVEPVGIFKLPPSGSVLKSKTADTLLVRRNGGRVMVEGHEYRTQEGSFPDFLPGEEYILFLYREKAGGDLRVYGYEQGAFRIVNGLVSHVDKLGFKDEQIKNVDYHAFADRLSKIVAKKETQEPSTH